MWSDRSSRFFKLQQHKAISNTMDEDGSEVERWSWLSSYIKQFSSSQNIFTANRHPCPPTHPTYSKRIGISNFKPPSGQIPVKENSKLKCPDVLKHICFNQNILFSFFFFGFFTFGKWHGMFKLNQINVESGAEQNTQLNALKGISQDSTI